jgi:nucleoid-associated protein YgaU
MQRYEEFTEVIVANKGKRRYATLYYPKFDKRSSDIYIITKRLDRLDNIAYQYYGDPRLWVVLAKSNKLHAGSIHPPVGFRLRIPYPLNIGMVEEKFKNAQF